MARGGARLGGAEVDIMRLRERGALRHLGRVPARGLAHRGVDDVARLGESLGGQTAEAAVRAGDEYDLARNGFSLWCGRPTEERAPLCCGSDDSAVGAQRLAVDPGAVGAGEEGDGCGDVRRLGEALPR